MYLIPTNLYQFVSLNLFRTNKHFGLFSGLHFWKKLKIIEAIAQHFVWNENQMLKILKMFCKFLGSFAITPFKQGLQQRLSTSCWSAWQDRDFSYNNFPNTLFDLQDLQNLNFRTKLKITKAIAQKFFWQKFEKEKFEMTKFFVCLSKLSWNLPFFLKWLSKVSKFADNTERFV